MLSEYKALAVCGIRFPGVYSCLVLISSSLAHTSATDPATLQRHTPVLITVLAALIASSSAMPTPTPDEGAFPDSFYEDVSRISHGVYTYVSPYGDGLIQEWLGRAVCIFLACSCPVSLTAVDNFPRAGSRPRAIYQIA
jgi:hypothetical protein